MKNRTYISILIFIALLIFLPMYFVSPTKAEVERFFAKNKCELKNIPILEGGEEYCVHYLRRHSNSVWGQINSIRKYGFLFFNTPFHYYHDITDSEDEEYTFTWVDTREGRFVYNAVNGEYVKEIDDKEDPLKKWYEDMDKIAEKLEAKQKVISTQVKLGRDYTCSSNTYNCADFNTQAEAQAVMIYCGNDDIHYLEGDNDGIACESLP